MQKNQSLAGPSQRLTTGPISFSEASSIVTAQAAAILSVPAFKTESCDVLQALGRVLGAPLCADRDQPPLPRVTRDGFAVRAEDLAAGTPLRIIGQLRAGEPWLSERPPLAAGEAIEIMTGASLPPGANAVLMVEHAQEVLGREIDTRAVDAPSDRFILPFAGRVLTAGENVVPRGSEARHGEILLESGTRLEAEQIALAASCGLLTISVYAQPRVAILTTGDELVEPYLHSPQPGSTDKEKIPIQSHQIYDSNSYGLAALVHQCGAIPLPQRPALDRLDDLAAGIREGLQVAPFLLLAGGVSMGKFDLVEEVLTGMGAEFFFTGVRMQPGKPVVFGRLPAAAGCQPRYFFGLPGNPVSAAVTFRVFVQTLLAAMAGQRHWQPHLATAKITTDLQVKPGLMRFLPAHLEVSQYVGQIATLVRTQGSGDLAANARANCYVIVPDDCDGLAADQTVQVLLR